MCISVNGNAGGGIVDSGSYVEFVVPRANWIGLIESRAKSQTNAIPFLGPSDPAMSSTYRKERAPYCLIAYFIID